MDDSDRTEERLGGPIHTAPSSVDAQGDGSTVADRRLAAIVQSSDDAIFSLTADGLIESWNPAAERLYGFRAEEIVGKHVELTAPPDRRDEVTQNIRRAIAGEHVRNQETVRLAKDGRRIDVALTISPIYDSEGRVSGMSTSARDITDRKQAEERARGLSRALEEARDTLELVTIGAADGITIQDAEGRVVYANLAAARISGYGSVDEFLAADPTRAPRSLGDAERRRRTLPRGRASGPTCPRG